MKAKQTKIQYVNLFEDTDFLMSLLAGEYDSAIKKGKMKIEPVNKPAKQIDLGDTIVTEATTIEELIAPAEEPVAIEEPVEVATIEEVMAIGPVIDEDYEEDEVFAQKCTDIELAIKVALDILEGNATDMSPEDFTAEVWAEAWGLSNETYYSMDDIDYKEEVSPEGETIIVMSADRLNDFMASRCETIESWDDEGGTSEASEDYVYEDDEVNVPEECDATILSFAKCFDCMKARAA